MCSTEQFLRGGFGDHESRHIEEWANRQLNRNIPHGCVFTGASVPDAIVRTHSRGIKHVAIQAILLTQPRNTPVNEVEAKLQEELGHALHKAAAEHVERCVDLHAMCTRVPAVHRRVLPQVDVPCNAQQKPQRCSVTWVRDFLKVHLNDVILILLCVLLT